VDFLPKDEFVIVLDFLPHGKPTDRKAEPLAQTLGEKYFSLLEVVIRDNVTVKPEDRIYVGENKRDEVKYIRGRISYDELSGFAKSELEKVLENIIKNNEKRFVDFFNRAGPISTRLHSLELLPGIGKKHLWKIIEERKKKKFESFEEIQKRVKMLPDVKRMILKRILEELKGVDRNRLFVGSIF
jgi:putative nucleotide binding protein